MPKPIQIEQGATLRLEQKPNGGWVIDKPGPSDFVIPEALGAYSSSEDMIHALATALGVSLGQPPAISVALSDFVPGVTPVR